MSKLSLIVTTYNHSKAQINVLVNSLFCQTDPNWILYIVHDGPNTEVRGWVEGFGDPRVLYRETPTRLGFWGHYGRRQVLEEITTEYVTWGNADNYYTPVYVQWMKEVADQKNLHILITNIVHHYPMVNIPTDPPYSVLDARFGLNGVDFISFIMKTEVAKKVGILHPEYSGCDGMLVEDTKAFFAKSGEELRWHKISSVLAVQN